MKSFCQDSCISFKDKIFERNTTKIFSQCKFYSQITERKPTKTSKLCVVLKKQLTMKQSRHTKGISLLDSSKRLSNQRHKKILSQNLPFHNSRQTENQTFPGLVHFHSNFISGSEIEPTAEQKKNWPRVYYLKPQSLISERIWQKLTTHFELSTAPQTVFQNSKFQNQPQSISQSKQALQYKTQKIHKSREELDESILTKKVYQYDSDRINNSSFNDSLASYDTLIKVTPAMITSVSDENYSARQLTKEKSIGSTSKQTPLLYFFSNQSLKPQTHLINEQKFKIDNQHLKLDPMLLFKSFQSQKSLKKSKLLFDTDSILSKNINEDNYDEISLSVVEQRNFFFEEEQESSRVFKKSIDKFIFSEEGRFSLNRIWTIFKNVKQKENKKIYSIKQFSSLHQRQYFNEYDIYLSIKNQSALNFGQGQNKNIILQLFTALSNGIQKKLHFVKEPFNYLLDEYIYRIKIKKSLTVSNLKALLDQKRKIEQQIEKIFQYFQQRDFFIREEEKLSIQDFVVCHTNDEINSIKFHSLYKFQKSQAIHKTPKQFTTQQNAFFQKLKLSELFQNIHAALFF